MTIPEIKRKIMPILKSYGVVRASIFGSLVRGEQTESSDIDLLVEMPEDTSPLEVASLKLDLEDILKRKVDVLTFRSLNHLHLFPSISFSFVLLWSLFGTCQISSAI